MELLTAKEAAQYLRISLFTLSRIEREGLLVPFRTPGGHRRYSRHMLDEYLEHTRVPPGDSKPRILLVDDGEELIDLLTNTLSSYRFARAASALKAGMELSNFKPHVVLVNSTMPGLDASDLCRQLDAQGTQLKVLLFSVPREESGTSLNPADVAALSEEMERLLADLS